jgi:hypothetical protein
MKLNISGVKTINFLGLTKVSLAKQNSAFEDHVTPISTLFQPRYNKTNYIT